MTDDKGMAKAVLTDNKEPIKKINFKIKFCIFAPYFLLRQYVNKIDIGFTLLNFNNI
jgi:hypothetical protein